MDLTVLPFFGTSSAHIFGGWQRVCWCTNEAFNQASPTKEFWENCPQKKVGHIYDKNGGRIITEITVRYSEIYEYFAPQMLPQNVDIWAQNIDIWPQNIDIWPQNIDIWSQNIDIWPEEFWPPPKEWFQILASPRRNGSKFWPPPEGMVPNFEPKNDLKKGQICIFWWFLSPNQPFRLFSHHILCPTGLMKE